MLIWGDMTALAALQFSHPEAGLTFDVDSAIAPETRRRVLDKLATDKLAVAGSHLPFPRLWPCRDQSWRLRLGANAV